MDAANTTTMRIRQNVQLIANSPFVEIDAIVKRRERKWFSCFTDAHGIRSTAGAGQLEVDRVRTKRISIHGT